MAELAEIWKEALPIVRNGVTGVGVWAALNACRPVALEEGVLILGLPHEDQELSGHLKVPLTKRLIEQTVGGLLGSPVSLRVIEGTSQEDLEIMRRRDAERRRLQEAEMAKLRTEMQAKNSWDSIYEQLSRRYAAVPQKSLPQNRARFLEEAIELIAEVRRTQTNWDDLQERNFARCLERLSQYCDLPGTIIAHLVLQRSGEL